MSVFCRLLFCLSSKFELPQLPRAVLAARSWKLAALHTYIEELYAALWDETAPAVTEYNSRSTCVCPPVSPTTCRLSSTVVFFFFFFFETSMCAVYAPASSY